MVSPLPRPRGGQNFRPKKLAISVLVAGRLNWVDGGGVVGTWGGQGRVGGWRVETSADQPEGEPVASHCTSDLPETSTRSNSSHLCFMYKHPVLVLNITAITPSFY